MHSSDWGFRALLAQDNTLPKLRPGKFAALWRGMPSYISLLNICVQDFLTSLSEDLEPQS